MGVKIRRYVRRTCLANWSNLKVRSSHRECGKRRSHNVCRRCHRYATASLTRSVSSFTVRFHHPKDVLRKLVTVKVGGAAGAVVRVGMNTQHGTLAARTEVSLVRCRCRKSQGSRTSTRVPAGSWCPPAKQVGFLGSIPHIAIGNSITFD